MSPTATEQRLKSIDEKIKQLQNQKQLIKNREAADKRKQDTRKKILIGASILSQIKKDKFSYSDLLKILDTELSAKRDRDLFDLDSK